MTTLLPENGALHRALQASLRDTHDGKDAPQSHCYPQTLLSEGEDNNRSESVESAVAEAECNSPQLQVSSSESVDSAKLAAILPEVASGWRWCAKLVDTKTPSASCAMADTALSNNNKQPWPFLAFFFHLTLDNCTTATTTTMEEHSLEVQRRFPGGSAAACFRQLLFEEFASLESMRDERGGVGTVAEKGRKPTSLPQRSLPRWNSLLLAFLHVATICTLPLVWWRRKVFNCSAPRLTFNARRYSIVVALALGIVAAQELGKCVCAAKKSLRERWSNLLRRTMLCLMLAQFLRLALADHQLRRVSGRGESSLPCHRPHRAGANSGLVFFSASVERALREFASTVPSSSATSSVGDVFHAIALITTDDAERLLQTTSSNGRMNFASVLVRRMAQLLLPSSYSPVSSVLQRQEQRLTELFPALCAAADELIALRLARDVSLEPDSAGGPHNGGVRVIVARCAAQELLAALCNVDGADSVGSVDNVAVCRQIERLYGIREAFMPSMHVHGANSLKSAANPLPGMSELVDGGGACAPVAEAAAEVDLYCGPSHTGREELEATGEDEPLFAAVPANPVPATQREVYRLPLLPKRSKPLALEEVCACAE